MANQYPLTTFKFMVDNLEEIRIKKIIKRKDIIVRIYNANFTISLTVLVYKEELK